MLRYIGPAFRGVFVVGGAWSLSQWALRLWYTSQAPPPPYWAGWGALCLAWLLWFLVAVTEVYDFFMVLFPVPQPAQSSEPSQPVVAREALHPPPEDSE